MTDVVLALADAASAADLATLAGRAARFDATAVVRVVARAGGAHGRPHTAGFFVTTPFDALAMRAVALDASCEVSGGPGGPGADAAAASAGGGQPGSVAGGPVDVVVEAVGLAARAASARRRLVLPPALPALRWSAALPPTSGWSVVARVPLTQVTRAVQDGIEEFRGRVAAMSGDDRSQAALASVAADVWGRTLAADIPVRLAHAASAYRFLAAAPDPVLMGTATPDAADPDAADPDAAGHRSGAAGRHTWVVLRSAGAWRRLDAPHGTVLARSADVFSLVAL